MPQVGPTASELGRGRAPPRRARALAGVVLASACAAGDEPLRITDPATPWPPTLAELGSTTDARFVPAEPRALAYEVAHPLWSSGSAKDRHLVLPADAVVDNRDRAHWRFPVGTVAYKTFAVDGRPLETRAIRKLDREWEYVVYLWSDDDEAELADGDEPVTLALGDGGVHTVPARLQCKVCHEAAASALLGVDELQLADTLPRLEQLGMLADGAPETPRRIEHPDATTAAVLGWFVGNCTSCHNGGSADNASFDLAPEVALANTVGVPTESSATAAGIRIVAGDPFASILYLAVSGDHDDPELEDMPPLGIDRRDAVAIATLRTMIEEIAP